MTNRRVEFLARYYERRRSSKVFCWILTLSVICLTGICSVAHFDAAFGIAKQSSVSISSSTNQLSINIAPSPFGVFGKSSDQTINVSTDNFTGYTLVVSSSNSTSLVNSNDEITTINTAIDESTFMNSSSYTNKWGYKPSHIVITNNNTSTTVQNTDYLPAPSILGDTLAITSTANSIDAHDDPIPDTYTMSFAAKVDDTLPSGTYSYTCVFAVVANDVVYNITYDDNTTETVTNMPSPNPQALEIDGGTPAADSHVALDSAVPTMTTDDMSFGGWCDVATTIDGTTGNYLCSGTTYQAGDDYPIDQTADGTNITLYAIWLEDPFPMVWSHMGACEFHGNAPSNITGSECTEYQNDLYIDTGIALNSQANASKDYEIHFKIEHYLPSENPTSKNDGQQTFVSLKVPSSTTIGGGSAPGVIVRRASNNISFESKINSSTTDNPKLVYAASEVQEASIYRIDGILYVSINSGPLVVLQDITNYDQFFDLTTWFGAYPSTSGCDGSTAKPCTGSKRYIEAEFSNMYIRLGDYDSSNLHTITFNANGGAPATTSYLVFGGNALGTLPEADQAGWLFDAWYTAASGGQAITSATVPTATTTYYAHWYKSITDAEIDRTDFYLSAGDTGSIEILNASDIEPYTLVSNDTSVATVDHATGVITAVGNGMTTITVTGTKTGDTRTIDVVVGDIISIDFDSQGGIPATYEWTITDGATFRELPAPTRPGYTLEGWYTGTNGTGTPLTTSTVIDSNSPTQYYANWNEAVYVCKIAKPNTLHVERCNQTGSNGCRGAGISSGADIQYGQLVSSTTMTAGDAYDCDVNNDGDWDDETERFYYFGTDTGSGNAKFVYYQSLENSDQSFDDAIGYLPTSVTWSNPGLVSYLNGDYAGKVARFMSYAEALALCGSSNLGVDGNCTYLLEKSAFANTNDSGYRDGIWLGKNGANACRIQTRTRALTNGGTQTNTPRPTIEVPISQVEPYIPSTYDITFDPHNGTNTWTETINAGDQLGSAYPANDPTYTDYVFQGWFTAPSSGTLVTSSLQPTGDATYHAQWKGTVALANITNTSISVSEGNTATIEVTNAADIESYSLTSNDTSIATVDSTTGVVTGVSAGSTTITMTGLSGAMRTIDVTVTTAPVVTVTIHFNSHGGATVPDRTINLGDSVGIPLPSAPTYDNNHLFQGWFTADTGGTQIDGSETPSVETTYHAQWKGTVTLANITNTNINITNGATETINITNTADIEGYSFTSNDTSVATVDASTGVVTGAGVGSTTITMTGTTSSATRTINVSVTTPVTTVTIHFNPHGGATVPDRTINLGDSVGIPLPSAPTYDNNHLFQGWFTADTGGTQIDGSETPNVETTYHAQWLKTVALATFDSNSISVDEGDDETITVTNSAELEPYSFSSLDSSIATVDSSTGVVTGVAEGTTSIRMTGTTSTQYIDIPVTVTAPAIATVCRLAVAGSLHTATRAKDSAALEYGQIASNTTPQPGDAYDCDVNYDDNYNATNERFYYLGQDGSNNAVLVAWNNYESTTWAIASTAVTFDYANASSALPGNGAGEWDHPGLIEQATGKAARFLNESEVVLGCSGASVTAKNDLLACDYLMEHTAYDNGGRSAYWLNYDGNSYRRVHAGDNNRNVTSGGTANAARPAIVVPYDLIEKYVAPPVHQVTVTFNSMGGTPVGTATLESGTALGTDYPSTDPTKSNNKFFGWYTDATYNTEVTPETVVNDDVTYYARWIGNTTGFPIVFSEVNECVFNNTANLSGTYCTQPTNISYVDTNVKLFTDTDNNYSKDFEIGFTITGYNVSSQSQTQATLVNTKQEATGYPGFVIRRTGNAFQLTAKFSGTTNSPIGGDTITPPTPASLHHVRIVRRNNKLYYAWNGGTLTEWWDLTGFSTKFDTEVWFGAASDGSDAAWRGLVGKLTDMYVRLGTYEEAGTYTLQFDPNGGEITSGSSAVVIDQGDQIGSFPTVSRSNFTLVGWYDDNDNPVATTDTPNRSQTYHAVWSYNSSKTPVTVDVSNAALRGYNTIVNSYVPQITTFNEASPIQNSTWGVAKTTYLGDLQNNFESNNCMAVPQEDSQIDWGGNHTVNCSKPSSFNTGISTGVDVYEYDVANDTTIGTALSYTKSSDGIIRNLIPGKDYYWEDSSDNTIYGVISAVSTANNRRLLDVGDVWNVRDLGGLPVDTDGDNVIDGTIDYGKLIRGGRLNTTSSNITELQNLGIDKEYDLAGSGELSPDVQFGTGSYVNDEVIHYNFDYGTVVDNENTYNMARKAVTDIMNDIIGDAQNNIPSKNVYFHCRVGADRTGTIAYILEGLLGVPDEQRYQDYEITSVSGLNDRTRYYSAKGTNYKKFVFMMSYLKTRASIVEWYLKDTTDTGAQARIAAFKNAMVTPLSSGSGGSGGSGNSGTNNTSNQTNGTMSTLGTNNGLVASNTNANNTNANDSTTAGQTDNTNNTSSNDIKDSYADPLGVSETTGAFVKNDSTGDSYVGLAIASVVAAVTAGGVVYIVNRDQLIDDEDEEQTN